MIERNPSAHAIYQGRARMLADLYRAESAMLAEHCRYAYRRDDKFGLSEMRDAALAQRTFDRITDWALEDYFAICGACFHE